MGMPGEAVVGGNLGHVSGEHAAEAAQGAVAADGKMGVEPVHGVDGGKIAGVKELQRGLNLQTFDVAVEIGSAHEFLRAAVVRMGGAGWQPALRVIVL
ncbi:MAG: hypothetical protein Fur0021_38790 [Candidatus Promineifilaceae bacterium]